MNTHLAIALPLAIVMTVEALCQTGSGTRQIASVSAEDTAIKRNI